MPLAIYSLLVLWDQVFVRRTTVNEKMSIRCGDTPAQGITGTCGRSGYLYGVEGDKCGHSLSECNALYGSKDQSQWCSTENGGCCLRVSPPAGNQIDCCLGNKNSFEECGNEWCPWSDGCREIVGQYCSDPKKVGTDQKCLQFCSIEENKPFCDTAMRAYCFTTNGSVDPLCSCIHAETMSSPIPACFDPACTARGYKTFDQARQARSCPGFCGAIVACTRAGTCNIEHNSIVTMCYNSTKSVETAAAKNNGDASLFMIAFLFGALAYLVWNVVTD